MPFSVRILRFFGILLLSVCALGVGGMTWAYLIEPNLLFVRKVSCRIPQWNGQGKPLKVVVAGDLHLMPTPFDEVRALRYVQSIMQLEPDLILLVGDYARGASTNASMSPQKAAQFLQGLSAPCGVFAIQGNHDFTFGWNNWKKELTRAGIRVLSDESALITLQDGRKLQLSGLLDNSRYFKKQIPKRQSPHIPHILLSHRPEVDHILSEGDADFIISGHTHGGQLFPLNKVGEWIGANDNTYGLEKRNKTNFIVTSGLSAWAIKFKTGTKSEFVVIDIKRKTAAEKKGK